MSAEWERRYSQKGDRLSEAEGDRICRMVLRLVDHLVTQAKRPDEPTGIAVDDDVRDRVMKRSDAA